MSRSSIFHDSSHNNPKKKYVVNWVNDPLLNHWHLHSQMRDIWFLRPVFHLDQRQKLKNDTTSLIFKEKIKPKLAGNNLFSEIFDVFTGKDPVFPQQMDRDDSMYSAMYTLCKLSKACIASNSSSVPFLWRYFFIKISRNLTLPEPSAWLASHKFEKNEPNISN